MSEEQLRAALGAAKEALPRVGESESVYCSIRGYHLRALVASLEAEPKAQAQAGGVREALAQLLAVQGCEHLSDLQLTLRAQQGDAFSNAVIKARAALSTPSPEARETAEPSHLGPNLGPNLGPAQGPPFYIGGPYSDGAFAVCDLYSGRVLRMFRSEDDLLRAAGTKTVRVGLEKFTATDVAAPVSQAEPSTPQGVEEFPLPEPVAWRGLTQSYPYPQDNDWRYGPWVYDLDPAKYKPLYTAEQVRHVLRSYSASLGLQRDPIPPILFDGFFIYQHLSERAVNRTSHENVSDVLDAVVKALRAQARTEGKA